MTYLSSFLSRWNRDSPWNALWAMMIGFFMIMVDATIVAVANPTIMTDLGIGYDAVIWVTSSYLLGYAVVLLVAGRLGDRFGTKNLYLIGLVTFTLASLWCGLSGSAAMLIAARVVQGVGAGMLTPQTLSTITRIFPPERRGAAMSVWGATAGVASLVGPLAGGVLVDSLGWEWIFFVNLPIGVVGVALAVWLVPALPTRAHRFDLPGVGLSGAGVFAIVFGLQQGQSAGWAPWIWAVIVAGIGLLATFVYWQSVNPGEPLIPLDIFGDRNFSLCNVGAAIIAFTTTAMVLPMMFYAQAVCGLSPTRSALLIAPMAIASGAAGAVRRHDHRQVSAAARARFRLLDAGDRNDLAVLRDGPGHADLAARTGIRRDRRRDGVCVGAVDRHRDPKPAAALGRRELRGVQHDATARRGARQCRDGRLHDVAHRGRAAGRRRAHPRRRPATALVPARTILRRDVAVDAAAGVRRPVRGDRRTVFGRRDRFGDDTRRAAVTLKT